MKKSLFLLALPLFLIGQSYLGDFIADVTDGFERERTTSFYSYCIDGRGSSDASTSLGDCVKQSSSRYRDFMKMINRVPVQDGEYRKGDRGGCDFINLRSFSYTDPNYDREHRLYFIRGCQDNGSINLYQMITGKKFMSNGDAADEIVTYLPKVYFSDYCPNYKDNGGYIYSDSFDIAVSNSCNYFKSDYAQKLAKNYDGQTIIEILKSPEYENRTYRVLSPFLLLLTFSPVLLLCFVTYKYKPLLLPSKGENITSWLESQKKFRTSLVLSSLWAFVFVLILVFVDIRSASRVVLILVSSYPLVLLLSTKFIVSSKD